MNSYRKTFPNRHTFLVVVHAEHKEQALRNSQMAQKGGADGIFLINHHVDYKTLLSWHALVREQAPGFWVGLNCLDLGRRALGVIPQETHGLWVDNGGVNDCDTDPTVGARQFLNTRKMLGWQGIYFGGVAFKRQNPVKDFKRVAQLAMPYIDVVTTSGEDTGVAADVEKIRVMKEAIGNHPLAIASGITPENVQDYFAADCFLVATGISDSETELSLERIQLLAEKLKK